MADQNSNTTTRTSASPMNQTEVTYFTLSVGESVKICPLIPDPPALEDSSTSDVTSVRGFKLLDPSLGELSEAEGSDICVIYKHNKSGRQIIEYPTAGLSNRVFYAVLTGILVHDHASIYEGGPAFATYFTEVPGRTEEGG